jgi:sec-independent protein translocase protein TatA
MNLGPLEIGLILLAVLLLFGYKKLPDASRSLGRSLRIFKGEMKGMKDDDAKESVRTKDAATTTPVRGEIVPSSAGGDSGLTSRLQAEAHAAEVAAAEARERAERARSADAGR